mgnify:CR=1 FL=1
MAGFKSELHFSAIIYKCIWMDSDGLHRPMEFCSAHGEAVNGDGSVKISTGWREHTIKSNKEHLHPYTSNR